MRSKLKGQISFDYYIALIIFIFFVVYFLFQISNTVPVFLGQMEEQRMNIESYQLSELLINDLGEPVDWYLLPEGNINRYGLSSHLNKTSLMNMTKIGDLNTRICGGAPGQAELRNKMGTDLEFSLFIIDRSDNNTILVDCQPNTPNLRGFAVTRNRIVSFDNGNFGELTLQVWNP